MKPLYFASLVALCAVAEVQAAPVLSFLDVSGDPTSVSVSPGGSFSFNVSLNSDVLNFSGLSYYLQSSVSGKIVVMQRVAAPANPLSDAQTANLSLPRVLNTTPSVDFGYSTANGQNVAAGAYPIDTLTFSVDNLAAPGLYTISASAGSGLGSTVGQSATFTTFASPATYSVNVVPEPASLLLAAAGGAMMCYFIIRRSSFGRKCIGSSLSAAASAD